jgi:hypothetical protein
MRRSEIELDLGAETLSCTAAEVATAFAALLREMRAALPFIRPAERAALRQIMARESGTLTVAEVFPDFAREGAAHVALRRLRTAQFIIPAGRDMWERDRRIAVKPFARLVWDRLGEAAIFGEKPARADEGVVDLAAPGVHAGGEDADTVPLRATAAAWEDDDIFDFLQDTPG